MIAMIQLVKLWMKQLYSPLVKCVCHCCPLFFSSFGRIGMTSFSLMMKLNGACQHSGNKGIHVKKLG